MNGRPAELAVLARAEWPARTGDVLPPIPGFIISSFSPLAAELAERCLLDYFGARPADPARGGRTAVLLASASGDISTAAAVAQAVDAGRRVPALLFFQSNPHAIIGYLAARWGLAGPVVAISPAAAVLADALRAAALLVEDGDADAVLVIVAEQEALPMGPEPHHPRDHGQAVLIGPASWPAAATGRPALRTQTDR